MKLDDDKFVEGVRAVCARLGRNVLLLWKY